MLIGYVRVAKTDGSQTTHLQQDALELAGVDPKHLYEDQALGKREDRLGLAACLRALREGETLGVRPRLKQASRRFRRQALAGLHRLRRGQFMPVGDSWKVACIAGRGKNVAIHATTTPKRASDTDHFPETLPWAVLFFTGAVADVAGDVVTDPVVPAVCCGLAAMCSTTSSV